MKEKMQNKESVFKDIMLSNYRRKFISLCGYKWLKINRIDDLKINNKELLPNTNGYRFIALYKCGKICYAEVKLDTNGLHFVEDYKNIIGWISI